VVDRYQFVAPVLAERAKVAPVSVRFERIDAPALISHVCTSLDRQRQ
jgi:hypothetical protein